jgi:predicted PurR-regulated permease PerM
MMGWLLWPFISVIILAIVVTGVFIPVYKLLNRKFNSTIASLLTCILIFFVLFLPLSFFVGILTNEAWELYLTARDALQSKPIMELLERSDIFEKINQFLAKFKIEITGEQLNRAIAEIGRVVGLFLYEQARSITTNVLKFIVNFFFMLLIIFYLLVDSHRLIAFIVKLSPLPEDQDQKLIQKFKDIATAILLGNGLGGLIQGTLGGIVFALFGLKSPFVWGVIMALLAFLPIDFFIFAGARRRRYIFPYILYRPFKQHRIFLQTQAGREAGADAHPDRISFHHRRTEAVRDIGHYLRSFGGNGVFNPGRNLSSQLSTAGRARKIAACISYPNQ